MIFVVPKLKFLIHASKYSFPCQILLFYFYYYYHYYYYYYYYYCMISCFKFLFLHEALVAMHICNALARLNFFNKGKWGCGIHTIRKFRLEWDFLEDGYNFFWEGEDSFGESTIAYQEKNGRSYLDIIFWKMIFMREF